MWTPATRVQHTRVSKRYQTDLTDAEWLLIAHMLPAAARLGRRREWAMREIMNAIFYVLRGGITWRLLPKNFPPWQTVSRWFARLRDECVFAGMNHAPGRADGAVGGSVQRVVVRVGLGDLGLQERVARPQRVQDAGQDLGGQQRVRGEGVA